VSAEAREAREMEKNNEMNFEELLVQIRESLARLEQWAALPAQEWFSIEAITGLSDDHIRR
jgi:hypothetical protein